LRQANWFGLALATILLLPNLLTQLAKWLHLLRLAEQKTPLKSAWRSLIIGYPLGFVTPGRLGEISRAFFIKEVPTKNAVSLFIIDKVATSCMTIGFGCCALLLMPKLHFPTWISAALIITPTSIALLIATSTLWPNFYARLTPLAAGSFLRRTQIGLIWLWSLAFYATFTLQLILLVATFSGRLTSAFLLAAPATFFIKTVLPIAFGDLGIRESAAVFFFGQIEIPEAVAFNASLTLYLINVVIPTLAGLPTLLKTRKILR